MNSDVKAIGPRLRMMLPELTAKEQGIVAYLLEQGANIQTIPIMEVAQQTDVSEAMIVKLAKKLGYDGYRDLRDKLHRYSQLPVSDMFEEIGLDDSAAVILRKLFRTSIQALEETLSILNIKQFEQAVEALLHAQTRDFYGLGGSAAIVKDAAHKFLRIGMRCTAYDDAHLMMMSAALLTNADTVLAVSHSGQTTAILDAVRMAKQSHARVIALTNYENSALANEADIVLCSTARGSPLMGENAAARIAQLNIIDGLFVCVAQRNDQLAQKNLSKTMGSVAQKRETR